jgi:hypothetical protein
MAERFGTSDERSRVSILAERFGMTNEEVEELLRSTREEYYAENKAAQGTVSDPVPKLLSAEKSADSFKGPPVSGVFLAVLFAVLLIALGIALSLQQGWFRQRGDKQPVAQVDTIQHLLNHAAEQASTPPEKPSDLPSDEVPSESLAVPHEEPPSKSKPTASVRHTAKRRLHKAVNRPALTTSSNFEAEEQLAELRADGNQKSHIKTTRKGGRVRYQVFEK